jgi:hypothetical protein
LLCYIAFVEKVYLQFDYRLLSTSRKEACSDQRNVLSA